MAEQENWFSKNPGNIDERHIRFEVAEIPKCYDQKLVIFEKIPLRKRSARTDVRGYRTVANVSPALWVDGSGELVS